MLLDQVLVLHGQLVIKATNFLLASANDVTNPDIIDVGFMTAVVDDTSPQLGGNLDVNGNDIVSLVVLILI